MISLITQLLIFNIRDVFPYKKVYYNIQLTFLNLIPQVLVWLA